MLLENLSSGFSTMLELNYAAQLCRLPRMLEIVFLFLFHSLRPINNLLVTSLVAQLCRLPRMLEIVFLFFI